MYKSGRTRRIVEQHFQDITNFVKPLKKQILMAVDHLLIQHAHNLRKYEILKKKKIDKEILSLTEQYIRDKNEINILMNNNNNNNNDNSRMINTSIIKIRKLQDTMRQKFKDRQILIIHDSICSYYNDNIALLINHIKGSCDSNNMEECMKNVGNLYNRIKEFKNIYVTQKNRNINTNGLKDKKYENYCDECGQNIIETEENFLVCTNCGKQVAYVGCKDTFKDVNEFNKWLSRSSEGNINIQSSSSSSTYNDAKAKQYIKQKVSKRNEHKQEDKNVVKKNQKISNYDMKLTKKRRSATYKRLNHFRETIRQARGHTISRINKESCEEIQKLMRIHNIKNEELTPNICRKLQSFLKQQNKSYEVCVSICKLLNPNFKVVELTETQILLLQLKFIQLESVFDEACKNVCPQRKNFPSYPQIYYRLSQDICLPEEVILESINFLKSSKLLHNADILHFEMCRLLGWNMSYNRETISYF